MKCPNCPDEHLYITHTYSAGDQGETRNLKCMICGFRASSITFMVERPQNRKWGVGGFVLAKKILAGEIKSPLE